MQAKYVSVRPFWFRLFLVFVLGAGGLFWLLLASQAAYSQIHPVTTTIWYVKAGAVGENDGSSWEDAFTDLQDALAVALPDQEIWVAAGLYKPTGDETDREATFQLLDGVAIYGGFAGDETERDQRDWETNVTVLSGDIDDNDITDPNGVVTDTANIVGGNSYHVVTGSGVTTTAILDGFFITAGQADASNSTGPFDYIPGSPVLTPILFNSNITGIHGGGMYNFESSPTLTNLSFSGNHAYAGGGGLANNDSRPVLINVTFSSNSATLGGGGMLNLNGSDPVLTGVSFVNNNADAGGGLYNYHSGTTLINVSFSGNSASSAAGLINVTSSPVLTEVLFIDNLADLYGGGMVNYLDSNPTLTNVSFISNSATVGGGILNINSDPILAHLVFANNSVDLYDDEFGSGGGMANHGSSPTLTNVSFFNNSAVIDGGGMANHEGSHPVLTNVLFSGNKAGQRGGGIYAGASEGGLTLSLTNVTLSGNNAGEWGGAVFNQNTGMVIRNSIVWGNQDSSGVGTPAASISNTGTLPAISYSLVQGSNGSGDDWYEELGIDLGNNLDVDPLFIDPPDPADAPTDKGNLRLQTGSPAIDAGNNEYIEGVESDLDGNPRIIGPFVDLGPYENQEVISYTITVHIVGEGSVALEPDQNDYLYGELVTVTAVANPGWSFAGWEGDLSGDANPAELVMDGNKVITAVFVRHSFSLYLPMIVKQ
jgi:predicted outer membrane repeat protein